MALPDNFEEKLNIYKQKIDYSIREWRRSGIDADLEAMAEGGEAENIREKYFPGWRDEDFVELLKQVREHEQAALVEQFHHDVDDAIANLASRAKMWGIERSVFREMVLRALR